MTHRDPYGRPATPKWRKQTPTQAINETNQRMRQLELADRIQRLENHATAPAPFLGYPDHNDTPAYVLIVGAARALCAYNHQAAAGLCDLAEQLIRTPPTNPTGQ